MGTVKSIAVAPDLTKVLVTVETTREAEPLPDRQDDLLGGQAAALRRQYHRPRYAAVRLLHRHAARRPRKARRSATSSARRIRRSCRPSVPGTTFKLETQADRLDQPRLADLLPRHRGRHRAGLGPRRHGAAASRSTPSCARRSTKYVHDDSLVLERLRPVGEARRRRHQRPDGIDARRCCWAASPSRRRPTAREPAAQRRPSRSRSMPTSSRRRSAGFGHQIQLRVVLPGLRRRPRGRRRRHPARPQDRRGDRGRPASSIRKSDRIVVPVHYRVEADRINNIARRPGHRRRARSPPRWSGAASAPPCRRRA